MSKYLVIIAIQLCYQPHLLGMFDTEYLNILLLWQHTDSYLLVIPASRNETAEYLAIKLCYLAYLPGMFGSINEATTLIGYQGQK